MLGLQVVQFLGAFVEETAELPQLRRLHGLLLPCPSLCNDSCMVQTSENCEVPQLQYFFVVDVPVVQVHLGVQSWTRSLTCPLLSTTGFLHSGGASDTVHRLFMWTFQLCSRDGYDASSFFGYGGDEWVFGAFCVIFRAPPVVPELSASFWSPRWWSSSPSRAPMHN